MKVLIVQPEPLGRFDLTRGSATLPLFCAPSAVHRDSRRQLRALRLLSWTDKALVGNVSAA